MRLMPASVCAQSRSHVAEVISYHLHLTLWAVERLMVADISVATRDVDCIGRVYCLRTIIVPQWYRLSVTETNVA